MKCIEREFSIYTNGKVSGVERLSTMGGNPEHLPKKIRKIEALLKSGEQQSMLPQFLAQILAFGH